MIYSSIWPHQNPNQGGFEGIHRLYQITERSVYWLHNRVNSTHKGIHVVLKTYEHLVFWTTLYSPWLKLVSNRFYEPTFKARDAKSMLYVLRTWSRYTWKYRAQSGCLATPTAVYMDSVCGICLNTLPQKTEHTFKFLSAYRTGYYMLITHTATSSCILVLTMFTHCEFALVD